MRILDYPDGQLICGDNLEWLKSQPDDSVDLVFGSPPYEAQRTYRELNFNLKGQDWVNWMVERWREMQRVSKGLVAMVVEGYTEDFKWSASPALLMADLHRAGFNLRKPPIYQRNGVSGSGGREWLRNDYEFIICTTKGKLPWAENTAMGHPPVCKPGGAPSNRMKSGERVTSATNRKSDGSRKTETYKAPEIANPGNIVYCGAVGGGNMGCAIAHEGDAPFPEYLAEFFIRSFAPVGGIVCEPFCGTGTTISVARRLKRKFVGIDVRESEIEKSQRRLQNAALRTGFGL
jgi:DNA modification methylase